MLLFFLYCMGTRAHFHIPFFFFSRLWEDCISGHRQACIPIVVGPRRSHSVFLSTICVLHLPHTLVLFLLLLVLLMLFAPYTLGSSGLHLMRLSLPGWDLYGWGTFFLFSTVIPLYIHLLKFCVFIIASSRVNRKWNLLLSSCNSLFSLQVPKRDYFLGFQLLSLACAI